MEPKIGSLQKCKDTHILHLEIMHPLRIPVHYKKAQISTLAPVLKSGSQSWL